MRLKIVLVFVLMLVALTPASALAQDGEADDPEDDVLVRINAAVTISEEERVGSLFLISADGDIRGEVDEFLLVIDGTVNLTGAVTGDVVVISGDLIMEEGSSITGDLNLFDSDVEQAQGAEVGGDINEESSFTWSTWDAFVLSIIFWIATTGLVLVTALVFAGIGGRQLVTASTNLTQRLPGTILAAILVGLVIPILAVIAFISLFGIPVALTLLLVVLPMLALLGYVVAGTGLGLALVGRGRDRADIDHPYLAALLGVFMLQLVGLIPFLGGIIAFVAMVLGTGALTLVAWAAWARGGKQEPTAPRATG